MAHHHRADSIKEREFTLPSNATHHHRRLRILPSSGVVEFVALRHPSISNKLRTYRLIRLARRLIRAIVSSD
jgi:hypothetical protein